MPYNGHDTYLEGRILSADPLELVRLLYHGASDAVRDARRRLAEGDIAGRSRAISNACDILVELTTSLDRSRGGDLAERLASLYDYLFRRLIQANFEQSDAPLGEVLSLLATLTEAWDAIGAQSSAPATTSNDWTPPIENVDSLTTRAWSF